MKSTNNELETNKRINESTNSRIRKFVNSQRIRYSLISGITLIEILVYVAILGGISVFIGNFLIQTVNVYQRVRAEREVISNARLMLETANKSIAGAQEIYAPTSRFNDDAGQLSLITSATTTPGHTVSYVDFWVDNGRLWTRTEGNSSQALSAAGVKVSRFYMERIAQGLNREAVKVTIQVDSLSKFPTSITLNSTTAIRGNY